MIRTFDGSERTFNVLLKHFAAVAKEMILNRCLRLLKIAFLLIESSAEFAEFSER